MKFDYKQTELDLNSKLAGYLADEGLEDLDAQVSDTHFKRLLAAFVTDFIEYQLSFDDFSSLCEKLLGVLQNKAEKADSDLFMACHFGAELNWYARNDPSRVGGFLEEIMEYYKQIRSFDL